LETAVVMSIGGALRISTALPSITAALRFHANKM
jgi:hypothetical protein